MKTPVNALDALIVTGRETQELKEKLDDANRRIASLSTEYSLLENERAKLLDENARLQSVEVPRDSIIYALGCLDARIERAGMSVVVAADVIEAKHHSKELHHYVAATATGQSSQEPFCIECGGSGEIMALQGGGPDAYEVPSNCPRCKGECVEPKETTNWCKCNLKACDEFYLEQLPCCGSFTQAKYGKPDTCGNPSPDGIGNCGHSEACHTKGASHE